MHPDWVRSPRDQCNDADVPFFFKQWGEYIDAQQAFDQGISGIGKRGIERHYSDLTCLLRLGTKSAGRTLDGVIHDMIPKINS
ncbi:MAG: phage Gp37/Gp68 family protein [Burkholderiales bacterium]|jgi:protein gp37|nr:phage Gp37/Gp68 family protein [Burkholderiales bacterium]